MQNIGLDISTDAARAALSRNDVAHQTVQALLDDLVHVLDEIPFAQRASASAAVLAHHDPPVADALLSDEGRRLQYLARERLQSMVDNAIEIVPDTPSPDRRRSIAVRSLVLRLLLTATIVVTCFAIGAALRGLL